MRMHDPPNRREEKFLQFHDATLTNIFYRILHKNILNIPLVLFFWGYNIEGKVVVSLKEYVSNFNFFRYCQVKDTWMVLTIVAIYG